MVLDGLRAAAPMLSDAVADVEKQCCTLRSTNTCLDDEKVTYELTIANALFGCLRSGLLLHYGVSPLTEFHLAQV